MKRLVFHFFFSFLVQLIFHEKKDKKKIGVLVLWWDSTFGIEINVCGWKEVEKEEKVTIHYSQLVPLSYTASVRL